MINKRIISLLPAATEIVCALGLKDHLVGRSHECDYPEGINELPVCSDAKFTSGSDSLEINNQVKEILSDAISIYTIDKELIKKLEPTIIITQAQCEVCAVSLKDVEDALGNWLTNTSQLISLSPNTLTEIFNDITQIAEKLDVKKEGEILLENLLERIELIKHKLKFFPDKPKVACIEWLSPIMVSGNWIPEMVEIAGGNSILAENGKHSPFVKWQQILDENPDIMVIMPCGFSIQRTLQEISCLTTQQDWHNLKAVKNNQIYIADGNAYFNRSGPRAVDSIEILAEIINPKYFSFGYEGNGWIKFEA